MKIQNVIQINNVGNLERREREEVNKNKLARVTGSKSKRDFFFILTSADDGDDAGDAGEQEQAGQGDQEQEQAGFFLHFHLLKDDGDDAGEQAGQGDQDRDWLSISKFLGFQTFA